MTTPSSCNSFFKKYLVYKLRSQTITFVISLMLNIFSMPMLVLNFSRWVDIQYNSIILGLHGTDRSYTSLFSFGSIPSICAVALFGMAFLGAVSVFDFCTRRERVDVLGDLPITSRERFTADFLSGYIANVGAFIPCAIFSMIVAAAASSKYENIFQNTGDNFFFKYFAQLCIVLFLSYTFAYIWSALVTVCCGKRSSAIIFTIASAVLVLIASESISFFLTVSRMNLSDLDLISALPPLGLFFMRARGFFHFIAKSDLSGNLRFEDFEFPLLNPLVILLYLVCAAALVYCAYRLFKKRKPERTGRAIAVNDLYKAICTLTVVSLTSLIFAMMYNLHAWWLSALVSIVVSAFVLFMFEVIRGLKKAGLAVTGIRGAATLLICFAALLIIDKTGVFGTRYINISPKDVESVQIEVSGNTYYSNYNIDLPNEDFIFTEKDDITHIIGSINSRLKEQSKLMCRGGSYKATFTLKNGETFYRNYTHNIYKLDPNRNSDRKSPIEGLAEDIHHAPNFKAISCNFYAETLRSSTECNANLKGVLGKVTLSQEQCKEFSEIYSREFIEKYDPNEPRAGIINCSSGYKATTLPITDGFTDSIAYIKYLRNSQPEGNALNIFWNDGVNKTYSSIDISISIGELEDPLVKELLSLLKERTTETSAVVNNFMVSSTDLVNYIVPEENADRVIEIMLSIIEARYITR